MYKVIIISPYTGKTLEKIRDNINYAKECMKDSFNRDESPVAFHLLYPGILNDKIPEQRKKGMNAAYEWFSSADYCVVYGDHGISKGMQKDIEQAGFCNLLIKKRSIYG